MALADALASIAELYGGGEALIRARTPGIEASFAQQRQTLAADSAARQQAMAQKMAQDALGLRQGAANMSLDPVPVTAATATAARLAQQAGNAQGWQDFLTAKGGIAAARNNAQADAFRYLGERQAKELQDAWAAAALRGGGGGGRGGGGGGYYDDEPLVDYPSRADQIPNSLARALANRRIVLEDQSSAFKKAGYSGPGSAQAYGKLLNQGMLKGGASKPSSGRRGGGRSF